MTAERKRVKQTGMIPRVEVAAAAAAAAERFLVH